MTEVLAVKAWKRLIYERADLQRVPTLASKDVL